MGAENTFHDYVDEFGANTIRSWLDSIPKNAKVKFNNRLLHLEALGTGDWKRPIVDTLTDECAGLREIRVSYRHQQYRLLLCDGPGQRRPTLLHGFVKPGDRVPPEECRRALERKAKVDAQPDTYRVEHDYE